MTIAEIIARLEDIEACKTLPPCPSVRVLPRGDWRLMKLRELILELQLAELRQQKISA